MERYADSHNWSATNPARRRNLLPGGRKVAVRQAQSTAGRPTWNFVRHLLEMLAAMMAGMFLLGGLVSLVLLGAGRSEFLSGTSLRALVMTVNMTAGMGLWMRHRGHNPMQIAEMGAAMFVPLAILIYPFWAGAIGRGALMGGMHVLMIPAMVGVMLYRRDVYTRHHGPPGATCHH